MTEKLDPWNVRDIWTIYDNAMEAEEKERGYCDMEEWELDLGEGITVRRMTRQTHPHAWQMGAGNFIYLVDDHEFAYLGQSQVHDQLHIREPFGGEVTGEWHRACNNILQSNGIPYRVLFPLCITASYRAPKGYDTARRPVMREVEHTDILGRRSPVAVGTNFMAKMHGRPWERQVPNSDGDHHLNYGFGLLSD